MARSANQITFVAIVVISVLTGVLFEPPPPLTKKQLLRSVDANATEGHSESKLRFAVGTNICIDLIVSATDFFDSNSAFPAHVPAAPESSNINSEQDLVNAFGHYFSRGAAAERFVEPKLFASLVASASALDTTERRLGGNAALMGNKLAGRGHSVLMSSSGSSALQELVNEGVSFSGTDVNAEVETHIILEYDADDTFQGTSTTRANRLILTPAAVPGIATLNNFFEAADKQDPSADAVIFSGLHLFESSTAEEWRPYLSAAKAALAKTTDAVPQHLELASLSNEDLTKDIVATLFPAFSSVGFNEEELGALFYALGGSYDDLPTKICNPKRDAEAKRPRILRWNIVKKVINIFKLDRYLEEVDPPEIPPCLLGKSPSVSAVSAALDYVFRAARQQGSSVSRLHFHSLAYHIVATADAEVSPANSALRQWKKVLSAAAAGSVAATYQACNVTGHADLHGDDLQLVVPTRLDVTGTGDDVRELAKDEALHVWDTASLRHSFVPVLVCKEPLVTVGLGDAISSSALAAHF